MSNSVVLLLLFLSSFSFAAAETQPQFSASKRLGRQGVEYYAARYSSTEKSWKPLANQRGSLPAKPASLMKLATSWLLHKQLGLDYQFTTRFLVNNSAQGDRELLVYLSGDPSFRSEELLTAAEAIALRLPGAVFSRIVLVSEGPSWDLDRSGQRAYEAGFSQSALNFNSISFLVCPDGKQGKPVVLPNPNLAFVEINGSLQRGRFALSLDEVAKWQYKVSGSVAPGSSCTRVYRSVPAPGEYFAESLRLYLNRFGVKVASSGYVVREGQEKRSGTVLFEHRSRPLSLLLFDMNRYSSNFYAGQLVRVVGEQASKKGTSSAIDVGVSLISSELSKIGVQPGEFRIADPSGLSHDNRLSPHSIVRILQMFHDDFSARDDFGASLAVPGRLGTLESRDYGIFFRGKTGSLRDTRSLAGYLENRTGDVVAFAIIQNGEDLLGDFHLREKDFLQALSK